MSVEGESTYSLDYSLVLTGLDLDELNDMLFNEAFSAWMKISNAEIDKLKQSFTKESDIRYADKVG